MRPIEGERPLTPPTLEDVLVAALRDARELDSKLEACGRDIEALFRAADLCGALAGACFNDWAEGLKLAAVTVRALLADGGLPEETPPAKARMGQLREALTALEKGESVQARRVRIESLEALRGRAKTFREQQAVRAVVALVSLAAAEDAAPLVQIIEAGAVGRRATSASPAWASAFLARAKEGTRAPSLERIEACPKEHPFRGGATSELAEVTVAMLSGPAPLSIVLGRMKVTRESLARSVSEEAKLEVLLPLAALSAAQAADAPRFVEAVHAFVVRCRPEVPPPLAAAFADMESSLGNPRTWFRGVARAGRVGYFLEPSAEIADELRAQLAKEDLLGALRRLSTLSQSAMMRHLKLPR